MSKPLSIPSTIPEGSTIYTPTILSKTKTFFWDHKYSIMFIIIAIVAIVVGSLIGTGVIQMTPQGTKIVPGQTIGNYNQFGWFVACGKNTIAIGGYGDNNYVGAVWIYDYTYAFKTKIVPDDDIGESTFGTFLAYDISGTKLAVAGSNDNNGVGAVWIYDVSNASSPNKLVKLMPPNGTHSGSNTAFGTSVISAEYNGALNTYGWIIGGPGNVNSGALGKGSVWIYDSNNNYVKVIGNPQNGTNSFGNVLTYVSKSLFATTNDDCVYIYNNNALNTVAYSSPPTSLSHVPSSMTYDVTNNLLVIGDVGMNGSAGAVYIYNMNTHTFNSSSTLLGTTTNQSMGQCVEYIGNGVIAVSSVSSSNMNSGNIGSVSLYKYNSKLSTYALLTTYTPNNAIGTKNIMFGVSIGSNSSGNVMVVGGPGDNGDVGAVWAYSLNLNV